MGDMLVHLFAIIMDNETKRMEWLDLLKFIAIFMMLAVHCTDNVTPSERFEPWYNIWGSLYGSLMRPAVPIFVMVTGALLLPVNDAYGKFCSKRIWRVLLPFLLWSVLYNLFPWVTGLLGADASVVNDFFAWAEVSQRLDDALYNILMIPFAFSSYAIQMWYVYLLIGLYLYMPIFSAWIKHSSRRDQHIFLMIWFVSLFIPYIREYLVSDLWGECSWNEFGMLYYFAGFNGYLLLGYYLRRYPLQWGLWRMVSVFVPMFVLGYCMTFIGFKAVISNPDSSVELVELFYTYCSPNVLFMTLPLFVLAQRLEIKSFVFKSILKSVSVATFGIWMSHYMFLGPCYMLIDILPVHTMMKLVLSSMLLLLVTWIFVSVVLKWKTVGKMIMG